MLEHLPCTHVKSLSEMFPTASAEALDLMRLCLKFNPSQRITAEEALAHPYVAQFHNPDDEISATAPVTLLVDDNTRYSRVK